jgi:tetratricopeptide (TPR) repeat protein
VEAEALLKQVVALDSANFGPMHPDLATDLENLGYVYFEAQRYDLDLVVLAQTLAIRRAMLSDDNPAIGRTTFNIASVLRAKGDLAAALPMYRDAQARLRRALEPTHPDVLVATAMVGRTLYELGRRTEAEAQLRAALAVQGRDRGLPSWAYVRAASTLAGLLIDERRYAEAEPLALRVLALRDSTGDTLAKVARAQVVKLYEGWGKVERAADYREPGP